MRRITGYRLASYDRTTGEPLTDWDVLDEEERAADYGWIPRRPERAAHDPGAVEQVAALQRGAA